jgi:hypothetical protein
LCIYAQRGYLLPCLSNNILTYIVSFAAVFLMVRRLFTQLSDESYSQDKGQFCRYVAGHRWGLGDS